MKKSFEAPRFMKKHAMSQRWLVMYAKWYIISVIIIDKAYLQNIVGGLGHKMNRAYCDSYKDKTLGN